MAVRRDGLSAHSLVRPGAPGAYLRILPGAGATLVLASAETR